MKPKRKICYITGTRADYGMMRNALKKINKKFDLSLIVTGMHLAREFGKTAEEIKRDGFKIGKKVNALFPKEDTGMAMAEALGTGIIGITQAIKTIKPDIILVLGDRAEALAGAIVGAHANIPVAHIHGGDQGDDGAHIDDLTRHAITKFSHIHFAATKKSADRIIKMGEEPWRVHVTGSPALDDIIAQKLYPKKYIEKKYHLDLRRPLFLVIQHSTPSQMGEAAEQIKETLEALKELNQQTVLIYPSSDAGGRRMIKIIKKYEQCDFLKTFKSLPREEYLSLMKCASVMVGNSSSGSIDSSSFKLPVVNIGTRESIREDGGNKIFVGHDRNEIKKAIIKALFDKKFRQKVQNCRNPYGDGKCGIRIAKVLRSAKINRRLLTKRLTY